MTFVSQCCSPASTYSCGGAGPPRAQLHNLQSKHKVTGQRTVTKKKAPRSASPEFYGHRDTLIDGPSLPLHTKTSYQGDVFQILEACERMDQIEKSYHPASGSRGKDSSNLQGPTTSGC